MMSVRVQREGETCRKCVDERQLNIEMCKNFSTLTLIWNVNEINFTARNF